MREEVFNNVHEDEQEEIDLDTPKGWSIFLEYANDAYEELLESATEAQVKAGKLALEELQQLAEQCIQRLEKGKQISFTESEKAQELYDSISDAHDSKVPESPSVHEPEIEPELKEEVVFKEEKIIAVPEGDEVEKEEKSGFAVEAQAESVVLKEEIVAERKAPYIGYENYVEDEEDGERKTAEESIPEEPIEEEKSVDTSVNSKKLQKTYEELVSLNKELSVFLSEATQSVDSEHETVVTEIKTVVERGKKLQAELESGEVDTTDTSVDNTAHELVEIQKNYEHLRKALGEELEEEDEEDEDEPLNIQPKKGLGRMDIVAEPQETKAITIVVPKIEAPKPVPEQKQKVQKPSLASLRSEEVLSKESLLPDSLVHDVHINALLREHEISWVQVERNLKRTIIDIEKPSQLDVFLRVKQGSIFTDVLANLTMEELSNFERRKLEEIQADLSVLQKKNGMQYEYRIYRKWLNLFDDMSAVVDVHKETTFAELCTLFELVKLLPDENLEDA